ncbi:MAG: hypothetical protein ABMB14_30725, partial [Myxococcota bacterium]
MKPPSDTPPSSGKPPYEDLSRLRAGELDDVAAAALWRRIEAEPAVAVAWAELLRLTDDLGHLPEEAPPAHLDARVLGLRERAPIPAARWALGGLAAAAVLTVALRWPDPPTAITVTEGVQLVDGVAEVRAGDVRVAIDGVTSIAVEPPAGDLREPDQEDPMKAVTAALGGAVAGAVVTVAVLE